MKFHLQICGLVLLELTQVLVTAADDYEDSIQSFLERSFAHKNCGIDPKGEAKTVELTRQKYQIDG